ncbi:MAG: peptidoglycan DD-metalloendopeptidase family protein [Bacteroidia bacterium]|nr:peptidoglycan DD-metalloendopeptidase family protein [Bacteroidia bacterium]
MTRVKYFYNPETCQYERAKVKALDVILNLMGFITLSVIMGIGLTVVFAQYYKTDQENHLRAENEELKFHYDLIHKQMAEVSDILQALQHRDDNIYRVIFEAEPIPLSVRSAGSGGTDKYRDLLNKGLKQEALILSTAKKVDDVKRKMYIQSKSYDQIAQLVKDKSKMLSSMPAIQPISNKQLTRLTSGFGMRIHPIYKVGQFHPGIDFAAPQGTPIYATADGVIKKAVYDGGYGNNVVIDHGYGYQTLYGHMSRFNVKTGQKVKRGECIGYVGSTGFSTAPHVHYEVIYNGEQVNPVYFFFKDLSAEEYEKVLDLASIENQSLS